ncbi:MAG: glycosyltransferase [Flavobacteriaceae bacterium]|nr:glycosyltransferase [Flavobacteriaceae bacterium]
MILSIVIPVYKVEEYIEKCVLSCSNQDISKSDYEIILVNDGSPDNSLKICEQLANEIENITIISQENRGLSGARNTGLRNAKGEYVWFVDSDDWVEENSLQSIISAIETYKSDIYWLGHDVVANNKVLDTFIPNALDKPITGEFFFKNHLKNQFYIWKFVYKRAFLLDNNLTFYEGILYEDLEFTPRALHVSKTCYTLPLVYYHYLMRDGSIINNVKPKNIKDRFFICKRILNTIENTKISKNYYEICYKIVAKNIVGTLKMAIRSDVKLPSIAQEIIGEIEIKPFLDKKLKKELRFIKFNLNAYYILNKIGYKVYKKIKK